ncbi:uncharacterized protein LOC131333172 isoform X2 [Rhododendron vialii]|uniref:uncharacterized protein LOC131333172 isoform X2 n=1 Tax=Rhododendron vialii TaxID=182163 RepID=UPI00265DE80F|nr:uncharacterized protein LOC131333172 isoform X2 [Rhododendron vialii]
MVEKRKKQSKGTICEGDVSTLLQRYPATTVLTLLQEVAQVPDVKIDWNELVKKTSTGISNAREYQMLWRHLAYRDTIAERLDDGADPQDDDSDLDYELEALPPVSSEASTEAAACVKVLIASGSQSDTNLPNGSTVEAPLTINIPNGQSSRGPSENSQMQGTNITVPVSVQKQPLPIVTSAEVFDANGSASGNLPPRKKRKPWSAAEDQELIAAVQKCGEGNWANILKGDFKGDRTASQLSQRWAIIRKRKGNLNMGSGSHPSEAQLATRRAVSLALDYPIVDNLTAACSNAGTNPNNTSSHSLHLAMEASSVAQSQHPSRQDSAPSTSLKSRVMLKRPSTKPSLSPDAMVKAAAVAAGARIATPSDAASLLKAAQAKNAVHIIPGGGSLSKSSVGSALPPNVHFIRTGLTAPPPSTYSTVPTSVLRPCGTLQAHNSSLKPAPPTVSVLTATELSPTVDCQMEEMTDVLTPTASGDLKSNDICNSSSSNPLNGQLQEDEVVVSGDSFEERVQGDQVSAAGNSSNEQIQDQPPICINRLNEQHQEDQIPSSETILNVRKDFVENPNCSSTKAGGDYCAVITGKEATTGSEERDGDKTIGMQVEDGGENRSEKTCENDSSSMTKDPTNENVGVAC